MHLRLSVIVVCCLVMSLLSMYECMVSTLYLEHCFHRARRCCTSDPRCVNCPGRPGCALPAPLRRLQTRRVSGQPGAPVRGRKLPSSSWSQQRRSETPNPPSLSSLYKRSSVTADLFDLNENELRRQGQGCGCFGPKRQDPPNPNHPHFSKRQEPREGLH